MPSAATANSTIVLKLILGNIVRSAFTAASLILPRIESILPPMDDYAASAARVRARSIQTSATMRDLNVHGQQIRIYTWGNPAQQPYVLFAHGWSSYGLRFEAWVARLRELRFAAVTTHQHAQGLSPSSRATPPDFTRNLVSIGTHFGPASAVVGHSLGGAAAVNAMARGLRAERLILLAPAADMLEITHRFSRMIGLTTHLRARLVALFERRTSVSFEEQQGHKNVRAIGRPVLVVHDLLDTDVPWEEGERYVRHASDGRLLSTAGLGHHRIVNDSQVIDACVRFLQGEVVGERVVSSPNLPYGIS